MATSKQKKSDIFTLISGINGDFIDTSEMSDATSSHQQNSGFLCRSAS